ncbi:hypothetical protein [Clostridium felsineum]|uniref:hypothetical protein n=1 Tax=Clostridium felsineum TaxID=36839 RepID=UPI00098CCA6A|nr:hypothetical protein [Clostridium felsineum]URZ16876.1 hypothetical protein CLFE_029230 [Clostridium felsineum DSM 794]
MEKLGNTAITDYRKAGLLMSKGFVPEIVPIRQVKGKSGTTVFIFDSTKEFLKVYNNIGNYKTLDITDYTEVAVAYARQLKNMKSQIQTFYDRGIADQIYPLMLPVLSRWAVKFAKQYNLDYEELYSDFTLYLFYVLEKPNLADKAMAKGRLLVDNLYIHCRSKAIDKYRYYARDKRKYDRTLIEMRKLIRVADEKSQHPYIAVELFVALEQLLVKGVISPVDYAVLAGLAKGQITCKDIPDIKGWEGSYNTVNKRLRRYLQKMGGLLEEYGVL